MTNPYALHMPHWPKPVAEPPGTPAARARALLDRLGRPQEELPPVIHVGGTKGKGSTIAFLRAMLEAAGYRVHAYTSPHIARFNERILLAGQEIGDEMLHNVLEETRMKAGDLPHGFFDATTAAAMLAFAQRRADVLLMEMGLGGEVDATSVVDDPRLTIMTTVSYDHMEYMGDTLPQIAAFECGLLRPGSPCIVSYQAQEAMDAIEDIAAEIGSPLYLYGQHWQVARHERGMVFADAHGQAPLPAPALLGPHQIVNAGNAIAALSLLEEFDVKEEHVKAGLANVRWKGRLERLRAPFLPPGAECWFDGGHNEAAAEVVAQFVQEEWQDKPLYLIFGTTRGKDLRRILAPFGGLAKRIYGVGVKSEPNAYQAREITEAALPLGPARMADSIHDALLDIPAETGGAPFRALVFGSLYLWLEAQALAAL